MKDEEEGGKGNRENSKRKGCRQERVKEVKWRRMDHIHGDVWKREWMQF